MVRQETLAERGDGPLAVSDRSVESERKQQRQGGVHESSCSLYDPLHGSDHDVGFSYKYDHFQYSEDDDSDDDNHSKDNESNDSHRYEKYAENLLSRAEKIDDKSSSHRKIPPPPPRRESRNKKEDTIGESYWETHKRSYSQRKTLFEANVSSQGQKENPAPENSTREYRDDSEEEARRSTMNFSKHQARGEKHPRNFEERQLQTLPQSTRHNGDLSQNKSREPNPMETDSIEPEEDVGNKEKNIVVNCAQIENNETIQSSDDFGKVISLIEDDEEPSKAEVPEEVAYIMAMSKSNHYSIMLDKDFKPSLPPLAVLKIKDEGISLKYLFEMARHKQLLQQQERNKESLDELRSKFSVHSKLSMSSSLLSSASTILGRDPSHPIDVTGSNMMHESGYDENSEDALETALYREVEKTLQKDNATTKPASEFRDKIDTSKMIKTNQNESISDPTRRSDETSKASINNHCSTPFLKGKQIVIENTISLECASHQGDQVGTNDSEHDSSLLINEFDSSQNSDASFLEQIINLRQDVTIENEDRVESMPSFTSDEENQFSTSVHETSNRSRQTKEDRLMREGDVFNLSFRQEEDELEEVENILIDLIRRKKFDFAIQRIRYFPYETFTPVSSSSKNLALHEAICGMVLGNDHLRDNHHYEDKNQSESNLAILLVETNPVALETPGDGGYLPIHIACSSSFREDRSHGKISLVQRMLEFHSDGARHNDNETGELPLHFAIRWICNRYPMYFSRSDSEEREDETIVMFLLMAYPEGATIRDHSGLTPYDILKECANEIEVDTEGAIFQRLERYLSLASQLSRDDTSILQQKNEEESYKHPEQNRVETVEGMRDFNEEREGPPIDSIEFSDIMSRTEFPREDGKKILKPQSHETSFYNMIHRRSVFQKSGLRGPSPEMLRKEDNIFRRKMIPRPKTKESVRSKSRSKSSERESELADRLLHELLDASDE